MNFLLLSVAATFLTLGEGCCNSCNTNSCTTCCQTCHSQCKTKICQNSCPKTCCHPIVESTTPHTEETTSYKPKPTIYARKSTTASTAVLKNEEKLNVHSTNIINNQNKININIGVSKSVINNISSHNRGRNGTAVTEVVTIKVPVKVPVCWANCTTLESTTPSMILTEGSSECCIVVVPCVTPGCNPYQHQCHGCRGDFGYLPKNPCDDGCYRRPRWDTHRCYFGYCYNQSVDCSNCHENFYKTYEDYSRCRGCFYK